MPVEVELHVFIKLDTYNCEFEGSWELGVLGGQGSWLSNWGDNFRKQNGFKIDWNLLPLSEKYYAKTCHKFKWVKTLWPNLDVV
jgi:hypothetical protein